MLDIARELNLSETTFVFPPADPAHTFRLRIFTPGGEVPFAGHPTVGSAFVLAAIGRIPLTGDETRILFEEGVGPVPVSIFAEQGKPVSSRLTTARLPELGPPPPAIPALAAILSLAEAEFLNDAHKPEAWSVRGKALAPEVRLKDEAGAIHVTRAEEAPTATNGRSPVRRNGQPASSTSCTGSIKSNSAMSV